MAKQDFAQVKASTQQEDSSGSGSLLRAIAIVVIAGLCFSAGYWLGAGDIQKTGNKTDAGATEARLAAKVAENKLLQAKNRALQEMVAKWKSKAEQGAHAKVGELTFYKELPKQPVTPAPVPETSAKAIKARAKTAQQHADLQQVAAVDPVHSEHASNADAANTGPAAPHAFPRAGYLIQLASFRSEADARVMQKKLTKTGFATQVRKADLGDKGEWFRLYAGPYDSRSKAEAAQQTINTQVKLQGFILREK